MKNYDQVKYAIAEKFPEIINRPGLPTFNYRVAKYADFRHYLFKQINNHPALSEWTYRKSDDPGIALLEGSSIIGDILTLYQEIYANEAFLRTSKWEESVTDLVRLIGYRLAPGLGGRGTFTFEISGDEPVIIPGGLPLTAQLENIDLQTDFETEQEVIAYPYLNKFNLYPSYRTPSIRNGTNVFSIKSIILEGKKINLKTGDQLMMVSNSTTFQKVKITDIKERFELTEFTIEGSWQKGTKNTITVYKLGRTFSHFGNNAPQIQTIVDDSGVYYAEVPFKKQIGIITNGQATSLPQGAGVRTDFGGPTGVRSTRGEFPAIDARAVILDQIRQTPRQPQDFDLGRDTDLESTVESTVGEFPALESIHAFPLNQLAEELSINTPMLIKLKLTATNSNYDGQYLFVRNISGLGKTNAVRGPVSAEVSYVEFDSMLMPLIPNARVPLGSSIGFETDIRSMSFYETIGESFEVTAARERTPGFNNSQLFYFGDLDSYKKLANRRLMLESNDRRQEIISTIPEDAADDDDLVTLRPVNLSSPLQPPFDPDSFVFDDSNNPCFVAYGNVAKATQGKSEEPEVLGSGDNRQTFQTFKLSKSPLTYHNHSDRSPSHAPEIDVYVNGVKWERVETFFNRRADEQIYIIREDSKNESWVQFGDCKTGAKLPTGTGNIMAKYRTGNGAYGSIKKNTSVQTGGSLRNINEVQLLSGATGGKGPETKENAREAALGKIQSMGRLVGVMDYESEALTIPGVIKAATEWILINNTPKLAITILMESGRSREISQVEEILNHYNRCRGPRRFAIKVIQGINLYTFIDIQLSINPNYQKELIINQIYTELGASGLEKTHKESELGVFGWRARRFGQPEFSNRIMAAVQNVPGVIWNKITGFGPLAESGSPGDLELPDWPRPLQEKITCDKNQILALYKDHLQINFTSSQNTQLCD